MRAEQVEETVRETLHAVALNRVRAPGDLADQVVRRRGRRRIARAAGTVAAVAAITAGAVFGFGTGGAAEHDRPGRAMASPEDWKPWRSEARGVSERGCLVSGSALYCSGSRYDVAKLDAGTGKRLWAVGVNGEGDGMNQPFAVRDGVVYAYRNHTAKKQPNGDYMGGTDLMAVDAGTGDVLWTVEMPQDDRGDQAAMLIDGAVLANTPSIRTVSALDPRTGKEKWHHTWERGTVCRRAVLSGVPYLLCTRDTEKPEHTDVLRLDPATGRAAKVITLPGRHELIGTSGDRLVLVEDTRPADKDKRLTLVSASGEKSAHSYRNEGGLATFAVVGDRLISVSGKGEASVYSLTAGRTQWTRPVGFRMPDEDAMTDFPHPVVSAAQGVVYFFSPAGDLSGLDLRTGEKIWSRHVAVDRKGYGTAQVLLYKDVLIARNGRTIVSLLPRIGD